MNSWTSCFVLTVHTWSAGPTLFLRKIVSNPCDDAVPQSVLPSQQSVLPVDYDQEICYRNQERNRENGRVQVSPESLRDELARLSLDIKNSQYPDEPTRIQTAPRFPP